MARWLLPFTLLISLPTPLIAATWEIDPFSFFHSPSAGYLEQIQGSPTLRVYFDRKESGLWTIRIPRSSVDRTGIPGPRNLTLSAKLAHDARGEMTLPRFGGQVDYAAAFRRASAFAS